MFQPKTPEIDALGKKFPDRVKLLEALLTDRTIVYIDYANVRGWSKRLGWSLDLRKLKDLLDSFGVIEVRFYFGTYVGQDRSRRALPPGRPRTSRLRARTTRRRARSGPAMCTSSRESTTPRRTLRRPRPDREALSEAAWSLR